jgi:RNA polymerase sigma-70 factor (ECF subfamily)
MDVPSQSEVTRILVQLQEGLVDQRVATDHLFQVAYAQLRRLAADLMRRERADHTLRPTALVNEAYLRLADDSRVDWTSRAHFFAVCARVMRHVLVDHARRRARAKRGGGWERVALDPALALSAAPEVKLLRFEDILTEITEMDARMARVVEMRVFSGMKVPEVAHVLGVSPRTVDNDWSVAKMWFSHRLAEGAP